MNLILFFKEKIDQAAKWERTIVLKRNEFLRSKGVVNSNLYFVDSGTLRIFIEDEQEEHTIRFGYQGHFIAALDSFISAEASDYSIQALKKSELKVISKKSLLELIESDSESQKLWIQLMELLVYQQLEREIDLLTFSPQQRYLRVLKRSPQLFQEIPNKYIASYLRMTPETLSRLKKNKKS